MRLRDIWRALRTPLVGPFQPLNRPKVEINQRLIERQLAAAARRPLAIFGVELVHHVHAGHHAAPDGVLAIQERRRLEADEKLAVGTVRVVGTRRQRDVTDRRGAENVQCRPAF